MDVLKFLKSSEPKQVESTQDNVPSVMDDAVNRKLDGIEESNMRFDRSLPDPSQLNSEEERKRFVDSQTARNKYGNTVDMQRDDELVVNESSLGAEKSQKAFLEQAGTSFMKGIGNHVIGGFGDIAQVLGGWSGLSDMYDGNPISRALQDLGDQMADANEVYIPEELRDPKFKVSTMMNPDFWSTHGAEFVPQLLEFIFLSKGAGSLIKKGVQATGKTALEGGLITGRSSVKTIGKKLAGGTLEATEIAGTGKGLGKLMTEAGSLTKGAGLAVENLGAGAASNVLSGMLNAAEAYNSRKEMKNPDGSEMFSKEELSDIASKTFTNNLKYMAVDILSWSMTYGGGSKMLKNTGLYKKGVQAFKKEKALKNISTNFSLEVNPLLKRVATAAGKGVKEGFEETFQETFESWAAIRAEEEVIGKPSKYKNFMDFYNSDENESTKAIAFGLGMMGGASFGVLQQSNKAAERARSLYNRTENLKTVFDSGDAEGKEWQAYHNREIISDIILNNKEEHFDTFLKTQLKNDLMTEEQVVEAQETFAEYQTLNEQAKNLNLRGRYSLMLNHSKEQSLKQHIADKRTQLKNNEKIIMSQEGMTDGQKKAKIKQMNKAFDAEITPIMAGMAQATANKTNLILGELADNVVDIKFVANESGGTSVHVGLNNDDYDYYVKDSDESIMGEPPLENKAKGFLKSISLGNLTSAAKSIFKSSKKEGKEQPVKDVESETSVSESETDVPKNETSVPEGETKDPITDDEIEELGVLDSELSELNDLKTKLQKEKTKLENPKVKYSKKSKERADIAVNKINEGISTLDDSISEKTKRQEELAKKAQQESNESDESDSSKEESEEGENSEDSFGTKAILDLATKISNKATLSLKETETYKKNQDLIDKKIKQIGGITKQFQTFVNSQSEKKVVKNAEKKIKTISTEAKKRLKKAMSQKFVGDIFGGKEHRDDTSTSLVVQDSNQSTIDPIVSSEESARETISSHFMVPQIGRIKYGPNNLDKMVAINQRIRELFPSSTNQATVFILENLAQTIGIKGTGLAIGSSVFIQENKWDQGEVFMHEFAHIYYKFGKNSPETKSFVSKNVLPNKKLIDKIKRKYPDYILYSHGKDESGKEIIGVNNSGLTIEELKDNSMVELPIEKQEHILEEGFAHTLQGPLSKKYNNFFAPRNEFSRQKSAIKWWQVIKRNAIKNTDHQSDINELFTKLNDNVPLNENNMRDFIVEEFKDNVDLISENELGFEARTEDYKAASVERKNEINQNLKEEQSDFEKSVFEDSKSELDISEILDEELTDENASMEGILNQTFKSKASKASKILKSFVTQYNKAVRLRTVFGMKDKVLFDRKEFNYKILELAKYSKDGLSFIDAIESSPLNDIKAFNKFLDLKALGQKNVLLNSIWFTMSNHRMVNAVNTALFIDKNGQVQHKTEEALSEKEKTSVQNMMDSMQAARTALSQDRGDVRGDMWKNFLDIIERIKSDEATPEDFLKAYRFMAGPDIKISDIWSYGYINVLGTHVHPVTVLQAFFKKDKHLDANLNAYPYKFAPLLNAISVTNRSFTQDSVVMNAEGNMVPVRITNNHITKELDAMAASLSPNSNGDVMSKESFLERYSHVTGGFTKVEGYKAPLPNQFLDNFYDSIVERGTIPDLVYYTGINDLRDKKANTFESSTAFEQSLEDLMMYIDSVSKRTFLNNMGTFGDSPRKFYMPSPKIKRHPGTTRSIYNIYKNITENPKTRAEFDASITKSVHSEIRFIESNGAKLSSIAKMKPYFDGARLNEKGKKMIGEYVYDVMANGLYKTEVFSPNIKDKDIAKRLKNSSSQVMSVNKRLKFEAIFFKDPMMSGNDATDGGMYILEEDAIRWRNAGLGVFDLKNGFKFLNYSIEKENPNFKKQTLLLKGYTTVLSEAEVEKNPGLRGIHNLLKERSAKYKKWHSKSYGAEPSSNFTDGLPNSFPIAIPLSSEKTGIYKRINDEKVPLLTELNSEESLASANEYFDEMMYSKDEFVGLEGYNFGPQQVMDKQTFEVVTPVQQINAMIISAEQYGHLEEAEAIQSLYSEAMNDELAKVVKDLKSDDPEAYKSFVEKHMDKEAMDQVQRFVIEKYGIMHPRAEKIVSNQIANILKVAGNKLKTAGTYSHQKSDIGYRLPDGAEVNGSKNLQGYVFNPGEKTRKAEIVLPGHLKEKVRPREYYTLDSDLGEKTLLFTDKRRTAPKQNVTDFKGKPETLVMDIATLKLAADTRAKRLGVSVGKVKKDGEIVGYYVEGDTVLATRVPSNGPSFTGVFEVIDFNSGEGNQVMVPINFTSTIGADLDGDALFIQHKGKNKKINEAIDRISDLWLSPKMASVISTKMETKKEGDNLKKTVAKHFKESKSSFLPFDPGSRRKDYEDSMVAKRNIGTVFNLNRVSNVLAAYKTPIKNGVTIDGKEFNVFQDIGTGKDSRNHKSALIANLILDNLKENAADALNINEHTVSAFSILTNLNVPLTKVALMMNSPMVKEYVKMFNENNSAFHGYTKKADILSELKKRGVSSNGKASVYYSPDKKGNRGVVSDPSNPIFFSSENQSAIIDMIMKMENLNEEIQSISKIMAGHNGIETNPYLLEKQVDRFKEVMNNRSNYQSLDISERMVSNPDMARYLSTAETTLNHTRKISPVYRPAMTELLTRLGQTINNDTLTTNQIKKYTATISQFINSRVSGINNQDPVLIKELIKPGHSRNIFSRLSKHIQEVKNEGKLETNLLLTKGLNMKFSGKGPYISLNVRFFDDSVTSQEILKIQSEFKELPMDLREDLKSYDLLKNGWDSPFSILPIMNSATNKQINDELLLDFSSRENTKFSDATIKKLEQIIVSKDALGRRNNFMKFNTKGKTPGQFAKMIQNNPASKKRVQENKPFYYLAQNRKTGEQNLFRFNGMPDTKFSQVFSNQNEKAAYLAMQVAPNSTIVKKGNNQDLDIELITISDLKKKVKLDPILGHKGEGMEMREEYWEYDSNRPMTEQDYNIALEFTKYDDVVRKKQMFDKYTKAKTKANKIYSEKFANTDFNSMEPEELLALYNDYAGKDAYAYAIITSPIIKALSNKIAIDQQKNFNGRKQGSKDVSFIKSWFMANNVPSDHPSVAGLVRSMEVMHKQFISEKSKYIKKINEATDALYKEKFNFEFNKNTPWNLIKRFYHTFFFDRKELYNRLYGNIIENNIIKSNGKEINEFKLKSSEAIEALKSSGQLTDAEYNFYKMFRETTNSLQPYSVQKGKSRRDYIPHTSMSFFESFSNRGILGIMQNSRSDNEQLYDVKVYVPGINGGKQRLVSFKEVEDTYRAMSIEGGNKLSSVKEYAQLRLKAIKLLRKNKNEDGSDLSTNPMAITSALNFGIMNRFSKSRSIKATEMPSMDLNHALSSYVHSTLFINGNENFSGFKHMQGVIDGIISSSDSRGFKNISKYVKINWKDAYLKNKKQVLLGKKGDKVVDLITKLNLFHQLGFKVSFLLGNVAAGKYHNIKNGSPKEWLIGEKRFWGTDRSFNPLYAVKRFKRTQKILKTLNFMDINVYDDVSISSKSRLDNFFGDMALMPMAWSEKWIQGVQFLGMLSEEDWNKFDDNGDYKPFTEEISTQRLTELENKVKRSQGKGYQVTDQRMVQQYSMGRMFMQFSRFIPTIFHDRFAKHDVDIYGKEHIGALRMLGKTIADVQSMKPADYVAYRKSLTPDMRARLDSGLKGLAMSGLIGAFALETNNQLANGVYWDANTFMNLDKLKFKMVPSAVRTTENLVGSIF